MFTGTLKITYPVCMSSRKKIAIALFAFGIAVSLLYVPMEICGPLGFRGTFTSETYCSFQGYYPVVDQPQKPYNAERQIRIAHSRVGLTWALLLVTCILIGTDYKKKTS